MHHISSKCDLLMEDGQFVDSNTDSKVEFHFNALLDAIAEEKRDFSEDDKSLEGTVHFYLIIHNRKTEECFFCQFISIQNIYINNTVTINNYCDCMYLLYHLSSLSLWEVLTSKFVTVIISCISIYMYQNSGYC